MSDLAPAPDSASLPGRLAPGMVRLRVHPRLRFRMPRRSPDSGELDLPRDPTATVGHVIQSAGVPLTEVGDLVVAGVSVSWRSRLRDRDLLDVGVRARPQPLEGPAFHLRSGPLRSAANGSGRHAARKGRDQMSQSEGWR